MNKIFLILLSAMLFSLAAGAQGVNGVRIGTKMTKKQVIATFGQPDDYRSHDAEFGLDEIYYYGRNMLEFCENGLFCGFGLFDSRFRALVKIFDGSEKDKVLSAEDEVRVGDPFSVLDRFKPRKADWLKGNVYCIFHESDCLMFFRIAEDRIAEIWYSEPLW